MSRFSARDITMTAVFAALAVVAAMLVRYGGSIVPFSLMPFVVMLAGGRAGRPARGDEHDCLYSSGLGRNARICFAAVWRSGLRAAAHLRFSARICGECLCNWPAA